MKPLHKVILVVAGYLAACLIASIVVTVYVATTNGPDRQTYGAMYDFGDSILFLGVCGLAAVPATGLALFFLRPYHLFWRLVAAGALAIAATGIPVLIDFLASSNGTAGAILGEWSMLSPLRIFAAPLFGIAFFLCALFAPTRFTRIAFIGATAVESVVFVWVVFLWFQPVR